MASVTRLYRRECFIAMRKIRNHLKTIHKNYYRILNEVHEYWSLQSNCGDLRDYWRVGKGCVEDSKKRYSVLLGTCGNAKTQVALFRHNVINNPQEEKDKLCKFMIGMLDISLSFVNVSLHLHWDFQDYLDDYIDELEYEYKQCVVELFGG
jgi:hypothetical protein